MRQRQLFGVVIIVGLALAAASWHGFAAEEKGDPGPRAANAKARRDAAKKVYEASWQRHVQSPDEGPGNAEYYHDWSVRWLQAERDIGQTKAEQVAALEGHLKRMRFWKDLLADSLKEGQGSVNEAAAGEFFMLEAEDWLGAAKAELK